GADRMETLSSLARVRGVYVPAFYEPSCDSTGSLLRMDARDGAEPVVRKRAIADMDAYKTPACTVVPFMDVVHDRATIEVLRGCTRGCRFCQAGMTYRPVRERSADVIVRDAMATLRCTGYEEVSLTSLSTADHSQFEDVLRRLSRRLEGKGVNISVPSLRVDSFSVDVARLVAKGRKSGLTFAPEAGTQRLRDVINKNVTEKDLLDTVGKACDAGWRRVKLYFMIGLPTETDEDVKGIGELVRRLQEQAGLRAGSGEKNRLRVSVSVSVFVPKAHTPFQWDAQLPREEVARRQGLLRSTMPRRGVDLSWHDPEVSFVEAVMARGGRQMADAIEAAWRAGARFEAWGEQFDLGRWLAAFEETGVDADAVACRERTRDEVLPWDHVSSGVSRAYLWGERERALAGVVTPDCSFSGCTGCDVCENLGVETVLGGEFRDKQ
ncbi:MAG: TIGR03960 family B12-binding radical SAM protein, partial [Coriobacteriia bacterium]|nr:TIGR03960 family B12-binding radical SAM protein [Coriobacteriia bacterium]